MKKLYMIFFLLPFFLKGMSKDELQILVSKGNWQTLLSRLRSDRDMADMMDEDILSQAAIRLAGETQLLLLKQMVGVSSENAKQESLKRFDDTRLTHIIVRYPHLALDNPEALQGIEVQFNWMGKEYFYTIGEEIKNVVAFHSNSQEDL